MLTDLGLPVLRWLDDEVLPIAAQLIESTHQYVRAWLALWEDSNTADELAAAGLRACCGQPSEGHCL